MKWLLPLSLALALAGCDDDSYTPTPTEQASGWQVGPIVRGENRSPRATITPHPDGWAVEIPHGAVGDQVGELSGLTRKCGPLAGNFNISFRVEGDEGVKIVPSQPGYFVGTATPFFQRRGDDWSAKGEKEAYRWYGAFSSEVLEVGQTYNMSVSFDDSRWTATQHSSAESNPSGFADAKANTDNCGLVFGGGDGYAHGLYATGPARLIITNFKVD